MTLKILTLNLWHGGRMMDNVIDFLAEQDADIVCLQEVYDGESPVLERRFRSIQAIQDRLKYRSVQFAPALMDKFKEGDVSCGNAVLAKWPSKAAETIFFNEPFLVRDPYIPETVEMVSTLPRILQQVEIQAPENNINVFNIHGVWDLDGDNFSQRRRSMRDKTLRVIEGKQNVILAGDTNAQPTNQAMLDIEKHLPSVFGKELKSTFNMRHKQNPGYANARVDMIFASPNIEVLEKACHEVDVSDHLPLTATLQIS